MNTNLVQFDRSIAHARDAQSVWRALESYSKALDGHILFTVMTVDVEAGLARRVFTDHPNEYPATGTKPIHRDAWFDIVHGQRRSFVANTIENIAKVFPDFELIKSLGCGSVINLPVVLRGNLVATINLLHVEHHYTAERVTLLETQLALPAKLCGALVGQMND
jgi:hypothetical protein